MSEAHEYCGIQRKTSQQLAEDQLSYSEALLKSQMSDN